jgi:hypothetical protein
MCGIVSGLFIVQFWIVVLTPLSGRIRYSATVFLLGTVTSIALSLVASLKVSKHWFWVTGSIIVTLLTAMIGSR